MCGIAGIASEQPDPKFIDTVGRMVSAIAHRGPDSHAVQSIGNCVLGSTRLAIVDLSDRGRQPMCNEDSTVWITYNGECYNAAELRPMLLDRGHQFRSATDTEVILHLYEEFGENCVGKLRGMFAFAIWDSRRQALLLARDRLGIKPLYYATLPHGVVFGSEVRELIASGLMAPKLDGLAFRVFLELGHIPPPWTPIRQICALEPGHIGIWQSGQLLIKSYWHLPFSRNGHGDTTEAQTSQNLNATLVQAARAQLMSDVPIALFLSGGVDSAVIGALTRQAGGNLTALTIGFEEEHFDESEASRKTAELLGIPHRILRLPASQTADSLDHALWAMDQPTVDGLNAYWISRAAAQDGFKVALSGQGGDELFGGYTSVAWFNRFARAANWLEPIPRQIGEAVLDRPGLPFRWRKLSYLFGADDPFVAAQMTVRVMFPEKDTRDLLSPNLGSEAGAAGAESFIARLARVTEGLDLRERIAYMDFPAHLEARLLRDGDAMSMAHSLEVRPIFLDHEIVEHVLALPSSVRLQNKKLLLDAVRPSLPPGLLEAITSRPKRTFTFPFTQWLTGRWREKVEEVFRPARLESIGVLNSLAVGRLWRRFLKEPDAVGWSRLWCVFVLARWCEIMAVGA